LRLGRSSSTLEIWGKRSKKQSFFNKFLSIFFEIFGALCFISTSFVSAYCTSMEGRKCYFRLQKSLDF
jgi:hypothetical protein